MDSKIIKSTYSFISKTIFDALRTENFDKETIYTLAVYLKLGVIRAEKKDIEQAGIYTNYLLDRFSAEKTQKQSSIHNILMHNMDIFIEIRDDIWAKYPYEKIDWLERWINFCVESNQRRDNVDETNIFLISVIEDSLETEKDVELAPLNFINKLLSINNETKGIINEI